MYNRVKECLNGALRVFLGDFKGDKINVMQVSKKFQECARSISNVIQETNIIVLRVFSPYSTPREEGAKTHLGMLLALFLTKWPNLPMTF